MKQLKPLFMVLSMLALIYNLNLLEAKTPCKGNKNMITKLEIIDTQEGTGAVAKAKDTLLMHYAGRLEDGTPFDSSHGRGQPFQFTLGIGQVIKGWDEGVVGMKVGGKRTLKIPSEKGYGAYGAGSVIPPHANLIFDIELVDIIQD